MGNLKVYKFNLKEVIFILGVVIANWNGEKLIKQCLDSFAIQQYKDFKIFIIDNGSIDQSINVIKSYSNKLNIDITMLENNQGFAMANNIGIKKAIDEKYEYILTLNNDTELEANTLQNAINEINDSRESYDIYQLLMVNFFQRNLCDAAGIIWDEKLLPTQVGYKEDVERIKSSNSNIMGACAGAAIYSAESLKSVKLSNGEYFCNNFFAYYEDVDLAIRLYRNKFKTKLIKNSIVYHVHSATSKKSNGFKEYYLFRNMLMYTKRNQEKSLYKKNKFTYYKIILANIKNNITDINIVKSLIKALRDGVKEAKNISYK